jgi:hypothetical protein
VDTKDAAEAKREFARFDQGPLEDQPAFAPENDDDGDATPPPIARRAPQRAGSSLKSSHEPPKEEHLSHSASPGVQDRWAQIRKNAAERAAQYQRPEDERTRSFKDKSAAAGNDDEDTSGEESKLTTNSQAQVCQSMWTGLTTSTAIESRVARIKARVAELTGTMEGVHGPQSAQASPSPQPTNPPPQQ